MGLEFDTERRRALKLLGGVGITGVLGGCCSLGPPLARLNGVHMPMPKDVEPYLLPSEAHDTPVGFPCIDVHAHFFNASDVNVKDYFAKCVAHEKNSPAAQKLIKFIAPIVDRIASLAPTADFEYQYLLKRINNNWEAPAGLVRDEDKERKVFLLHLDEEANRQRDKITSRLYVELNKSPELVQAYREYQSEMTGSNELVPYSSVISEEEIRYAIDPEKKGIASKANPALLQGHPSGGYIEFIGHMLSYRWTNLQTYAQFNTQENSSFRINAVFSALVDFDYWLDCFSASAREDQMKLHSLLSILSGGYMLPLISYNPWTDIKQSDVKQIDASLELVKTAVKEYGYIGVKIYPPVGYFPFGNNNPKNAVESVEKRPDLKMLDEKLCALFEWCAANSVPVMAHTNETLGRDDVSDEFGGPKGWLSLLKKYDGYKGSTPIINLAHFGGAISSPGTTHNWPKQFACYMSTESGKNVYGDLGYWTELTSCDNNASCDAAVGRLRSAATVFPGVKSRLMFGSDWFMTSKEENWYSYAVDIWKNSKDVFPEDIDFRKKLFYSNAMSCFGLYKNGSQYQKVYAGFKSKPTWLPSVEKPLENRSYQQLTDCD